MRMRLFMRRCRNCDLEYEVAVFPKRDVEMLMVVDYRKLGIQPEPGVKAPCPRCISVDAEDLPGVPTLIGDGDVGGAGKFYPYFDRGLNRYVRNAQHRKQLCRELGVQPLESKDELDVLMGTAARADAASYAAIDEWHELLDYYNSDAECRQALDIAQQMRENGDGFQIGTGGGGYEAEVDNVERTRAKLVAEHEAAGTPAGRIDELVDTAIESALGG